MTYDVLPARSRHFLTMPAVSTEPGTTPTPWEGKTIASLPGYWFLGKMGKRVLRPGGIALSRAMLAALAITKDDDVVEYAPGLGSTATIALEHRPKSYLGIEKDAVAASSLTTIVARYGSYRVEAADATVYDDLPSGSASVIYGESMLTIHNEAAKRKLLERVYKTLRPGGRFAFQELSLIEAAASPEAAADFLRELMAAVRHPAWPLSVDQWRTLVYEIGFEIVEELRAPVRLLEVERLREDEGDVGAITFLSNVLEDDEAIKRFLAIRSFFRSHSDEVCGYCLVCRKPATN
jgi:SAM-dependent methyltransferase